jgi:hypothetical protein
VPITAIAERLGHASAAITYAIYAHAMPADNQAAAMAWSQPERGSGALVFNHRLSLSLQAVSACFGGMLSPGAAQPGKRQAPRFPAK